MTTTTTVPREDIVTGATPTCVYCLQVVTEVQDPYSFVLDYGINGDFGCGEHPLNDEEGTYGHIPVFSPDFVTEVSA